MCQLASIVIAPHGPPEVSTMWRAPCTGFVHPASKVMLVGTDESAETLKGASSVGGLLSI